MKLRDFFARKPVFTHAEFVAFLHAEGPRSVKTRESLLSYYTRTGRILRVRRGLYITVPPGVDPEARPLDPYLLAGKMTDDAVLAYHTALEFHGKAHSVHEQFLYLTKRAPRPVTFRSYRFRGVSVPKALHDKGQESFGLTVAERAGIDVRVTSLERTLVDVLDRPKLGGGWEEIWRSLESVEFFDLDQVVRYALLLGNATTIAKVGFYLEQHRDALMVDDAHLESLRAHRPKQPHCLARISKAPRRLVAEWNLVVPEEILQQSWAEVT
ncbi:MAG: hypothetical protein KAT27_01670 [Desulfobacterales bacterium]|nr:hypothetical protein [Desulfobacterales bacterium]